MTETSEDAPALPMPATALVRDRDIEYELFVPHADQDFIQHFLQSEGKPYERQMLRDMASRLSAGDLVLDVGAHIGNHAFYLANIAKARVIAFEPNAELADAMAATIAHFNLHDFVNVHAVGVGAEAGTAHFKTEVPDNLGAQELETGDGEISIVALDSFSFDSPVQLVKVDVEGMELEVLEGAAELIARDRPLLYVECRDEEAFEHLTRWAGANEYACWDSFNATPTHLLRPAESVDVATRLERLALRSVMQDYRYRARLIRANRRQQETDKALLELQKAHATTLSTNDSLQSALATRQEKLDETLRRHGVLEAKLDEANRQHLQRANALKKARQVAEARTLEVEDSTTHKLGEAFASAATSWRGFLGLPVKLARLAARGVSRARERSNRESTESAESLAIEAPDDFAPYILDWIAQNPRSTEAVSILYADINVNVVDGSSVWLSSMASILSSGGPCILVSKAPVTRDVILSNVKNSENLIVIEPTIVPGLEIFDIAGSIRLIRTLDNLLPQIKAVVVRGLEAAVTLVQDRQFQGRSVLYLTDFFSIDDGRRITSSVQRHMLTTCVTRAGKIVAQTRQIADEIALLTGREFDVVHIPPVIPDELPHAESRPATSDGAIKIGYAGKINSRWGVIELLEWAEEIIGDGLALELHIVADKITNGPDPGFENLQHDITAKMEAVGAKHYTGLNRNAAMNLMAQMDFVWCYRPSLLEDNTLELSTKLVEMVAVEARCICYPNTINKEALGGDYPFFISNIDDLRRVLTDREWKTIDEATAERIRQRHSLSRVIASARSRLVPEPESDRPSSDRCIVFSGHDFKFIDAYISELKRRNGQVARDVWHWGAVQNQDALMQLHKRADVVFCEWGLANAVWHSKHSPSDQRLLIRIHAQEIRERARRFGAAIDWERVDLFIFVSEEIRDIAIEMWDWPEDKTVVIPNYVLGQEFTPIERRAPKQIVLGIVGIVPRLKRLDRAIDLLEQLQNEGVDARLRIKGHRPETLEFMNAPGRRPELDYYNKQYERIASSRLLQDCVHFDPWGNDIATWYGRVHAILSCSESESFHYALADGVLTGCLPVVWPWPGAGRTFDQDWVVNDTASAARRIQDWMGESDVARAKLARQNRDLILQRYGSREIFPILDELILGRIEER